MCNALWDLWDGSNVVVTLFLWNLIPVVLSLFLGNIKNAFLSFRYTKMAQVVEIFP